MLSPTLREGSRTYAVVLAQQRSAGIAIRVASRSRRTRAAASDRGAALLKVRGAGKRKRRCLTLFSCNRSQ
jgi:hypothetical protein